MKKPSEVAKLPVIRSICCGIDVHKNLLVACLICGDQQETRRFNATTPAIESMAFWLMEHQCHEVAMESTGSYWKPVFNILECHGIRPVIINPSSIKQRNRHKTDYNDAQWIALLFMHNLLDASYIPDKSQRELREALHLRTSLMKTRTQLVNRVQKILEGGNIKLSSYVATIIGQSARVLLDAILKGQTLTPEIIGKMQEEKQISSRLLATREELADSLNGYLTPLQKTMIRMQLEQIDMLTKNIDDLWEEIEENMSKKQHAACEVVETIPGVGRTSAVSIVAQIGVDMEQFPTEKHLASWAGVCPLNAISAGVTKKNKSKKGNKMLRTSLVLCSQAAARKKGTYYYGRFEELRKRMCYRKALIAIAHSMLTTIYYMLKTGTEYREMGMEEYAKRKLERERNRHVRKLRNLGYAVVIAADTESA